MTALTNTLRSETTKVLSMRSSLVYAILLTGSLFGPVTLYMWFSGETDPAVDWSLLSAGAMIFQVVAVVFAAATTAGDIRNHMHAQAFLTQRNRSLWVLSKVVVTAVFTLVTYVAGTGLAMVSGVIFGGHLDLGSEPAQFAANLVGCIVFASLSVGLACVIRSQVGAVALPIVWMMVIEGMIAMAAGRYEWLRPVVALAPGERQMQLAYGMDTLELGISTAGCYLILVGWVVVMTVLGLWRNAKVDVR
ncbi:ABC transporter permease subunit [Corynebacterium glyciniphilum]|uniref:ABC transporter permease subunit n=1 Tax=Corynebacterium glyciniphilum TaxID=1404244 RepID=UPI0026516FE6|nr:ABC transporter permease subunit [Corynebacterium glyciniphilum]MDN6706620.1 ABC transporter permease [Corynebacterium glyciniphilum]